MESEKLIYWLTLGVLAMATITGSLRGWENRLAERSVAMMSRASETATNYAELARVVLGSSEGGAMRSQRTAVATQSSLACLERVLVRRQAEMARLQAMRVQVRMLQRAPRTTVWPMQNIVVEVPQTTDLP